jgi:uncharacterized protein YqgC (DUF456 family)
MDVVLILLGLLLILAGVAGAVLPIIPGPPLVWLGFLSIHFSSKADFDYVTHGVVFGAMAAITTIDLALPVWTTKKFGGSRAGMWGAGVGIVVGLFFGPFGLMLGPFIGALCFELVASPSQPIAAVKSAFGALAGFLLGTGLKLVYGLVVLVLCAAALL